jgi:hypothetical protein
MTKKDHHLAGVPVPERKKLRSVIDEKTIKQICAMVSQGSTLLAACQQADVTIDQFTSKVRRNSLYSELYAKSREDFKVFLEERKQLLGHKGINKIDEIISAPLEKEYAAVQLGAAKEAIRISGIGIENIQQQTTVNIQLPDKSKLSTTVVQHISQDVPQDDTFSL